MDIRRSTSRTYWIIALLLVMTVPILITMAKRDSYLSPSDPVHYLLDASKSKVAHGPILQAPLLLCAVTVRVPLQPQMRVEWYLEPTSSLFLYLLGITASLQHRPPPALFI
jgi:hypothetical protein